MAAKRTIEIHLENSCFHFMDYQMNFFLLFTLFVLVLKKYIHHKVGMLSSYETQRKQLA